jgi:hypothetical protein
LKPHPGCQQLEHLDAETLDALMRAVSAIIVESAESLPHVIVAVRELVQELVGRPILINPALTDLGRSAVNTELLVEHLDDTNLGALTERAIEINGGRDGYNGSAPPLMRTNDGRYIQFAGCQRLGDEQDWQGHPFDLKVFDEATQFLELQVRFHLGWLRSTAPGQRVRAVLGTNPPIDAQGDWIVGMFRPWLDVTHPKPAKAGELRWFVTAPDGSDLEVDGPNPIDLPGAREPVVPMSRSFIPAKLSDNPYLINTGYQAKLDGLPEPIRSAVRDGNFMAARADDEFQVIPMAWIMAAQARWQPDGWRGHAMTAAGLDIGADALRELPELRGAHQVAQLVQVGARGVDSQVGVGQDFFRKIFAGARDGDGAESLGAHSRA